MDGKVGLEQHPSHYLDPDAMSAETGLPKMRKDSNVKQPRGMDGKVKPHNSIDKHNPWVTQKWTAAGNLTLLKQVVNTYEDKHKEENANGKKLKRIRKIQRETLHTVKGLVNHYETIEDERDRLRVTCGMPS